MIELTQGRSSRQWASVGLTGNKGKLTSAIPLQMPSEWTPSQVCHTRFGAHTISCMSFVRHTMPCLESKTTHTLWIGCSYNCFWEGHFLSLISLPNSNSQLKIVTENVITCSSPLRHPVDSWHGAILQIFGDQKICDPDQRV